MCERRVPRPVPPIDGALAIANRQTRPDRQPFGYPVRMGPQAFLDELSKHRATAILRTNDQQKAARAMNAAVAGGFRIVEFTLTVPGVYELIEEFSAKPGVIVGAGTVLEVSKHDSPSAPGLVFWSRRLSMRL